MKILKIWHKLRGKNTQITLEEYWESIDEMLLSNWIKCLDGDHRYAREIVKKDSEETEDDLIEWLRIYDGYLKKYGFNKKYLRILKVLGKIALLELKWVKTRNPFLETRIEIEKEKLKNLRKEHGPGVSTEKALILIGKCTDHILGQMK